MRNTTLLFSQLALILWVFTRSVTAQNDPGAMDKPVRWHRSEYKSSSWYPYLENLPEWSKIPTLLGWINCDEPDWGSYLAYSQLVALARADFKAPYEASAQALSDEVVSYERSRRALAWTNWWNSVGQNYEELLRERGRENAGAWKLVSRDGSAPLPAYKIAIPNEWTLKTSYKAGDYNAVHSECMTLRRITNNAILFRSLRMTRNGPLELELWQSLTLEEADNIAFAVAYAIDHPWFFKSNFRIDRVPVFEGRSLSVYYPWFEYKFTDGGGATWWNDDPEEWFGRGRGRMDARGLGSVCMLLWRTFPENSLNTAVPGGRWRRLNVPRPEILEIVSGDLVIRGEILEILRHPQRITDALELLADRGNALHIPALTQFEADLPKQLEQAKIVLAADHNRALTQASADRLLAAAAKAKAAIQRRDQKPE